MLGCSNEEVESLEQQCGLTLPSAYRDFLRSVGKQAGTFLVGSDLGYQWLMGNQAFARKLATDSGFEWPPDAFAFVLHQGYSGLFFRTGEGEDPPVYTIVEEEPPRRVFNAFTEWFDAAIEDEARLQRDQADQRP
jgi:hypothetical protein